MDVKEKKALKLHFSVQWQFVIQEIKKKKWVDGVSTLFFNFFFKIPGS